MNVHVFLQDESKNFQKLPALIVLLPALFVLLQVLIVLLPALIVLLQVLIVPLPALIVPLPALVLHIQWIRNLTKKECPSLIQIRLFSAV